jgi:hypothetical protein
VKLLWLHAGAHDFPVMLGMFGCSKETHFFSPFVFERSFTHLGKARTHKVSRNIQQRNHFFYATVLASTTKEIVVS